LPQGQWVIFFLFQDEEKSVYPMNENFLAFIWKYRLYDPPLFTVDGQKIEVLSPGTENHDSGPDFFNARIRLDDMIWVGNVEIHNVASDWYIHRHQFDPAFNNTVLHVVYTGDQPVATSVGYTVPQVELRNYVARAPAETYRRMMEALRWIPCEHLLDSVSTIKIEKMLERCLLERLEEKMHYVSDVLSRWNGAWMQTLFIMLAKAFGSTVNATAFELLAQATPVSLILKNADHLQTLEALLFGQAGMLSSQFRDPYPQALFYEYQYLKHKYDLHTLPYSCWKFMRIRPSGFPTVRIAQMAAFFNRNCHRLSAFLHAPDETLLFDAFNLQASEYWTSHLKFDVASTPVLKKTGPDTVQSIIINSVIPVAFAYLQHANPAKLSKIPDLLYRMPPEKNKIIRKWNAIAPAVTSAGHSQAVLQLKSSYCDEKRCLDCMIGYALLTQQRV